MKCLTQPLPNPAERWARNLPIFRTSKAVTRHLRYRRPRPCLGLGLALLTGLSLNSSPAAGQENVPRQTPLVMNWTTADWNIPSSRPGFPEGLRNAPIATDPATGGVTYLARFPAGSRFAMHWHTYTETVVVLQGSVQITLDGVRHTATEGSYIIIPGEAHHEWLVPEEGDVVLLARRDGAADFYFVEP